MLVAHLTPLLLLLGQFKPAEQNQSGARLILIESLYSAGPEVALHIASSLVSQPLEQRHREELLRVVEGVSQQLAVPSPVSLIAGHHTDRPSGFLANATNLPITKADAHALMARYWLKSNPTLARDHVMSALLLHNRGDGCKSLVYPRTAALKSLLLETFSQGFTTLERKRSEDLHFALQLIGKSNSPAVLASILSSVAAWRLSQEAKQEILTAWMAKFMNTNFANREFMEVWVLRPDGRDALQTALKAGVPPGLLEVVATRMDLQMSGPSCLDHKPDEKDISFLDSLLSRRVPAPLEWLSEMLTASGAQTRKFYYGSIFEGEARQPVFWTNDEAKKLFFSIRRLYHDPRILSSSHPSDRQAAVSELMDCVAEMAKWHPDSESLDRQLVQKMNLFFMALSAVPKEDPARSRVIDLAVPVWTEAFRARDVAPVAVMQFWNTVSKLMDSEGPRGTSILKLAQAPNPNIRLLTLLAIDEFSRKK